MERRSSQVEAEPAVTGERPHSERHAGVAKPGLVTRLKRNWVLHGIYEYTKAYIPIFALVISLLVLLWVVQTFVPKAPKPLTLADRWVQIEQKYTPQREAARQKIENAFGDYQTQIMGYTSFRDATKSWLDEVRGVSDWGVAQDTVGYFLSDGQNELDLLNQVVASKTPDEAVSVGGGLATTDTNFLDDVGLVRSDLGLSAVSESALPEMSANPCLSPVPSASASLVPSYGATPSGSLQASASLLGSPTAAASGSAVPSVTPCITASPAPTATPSASPTPAPSPSPSPSPSMSPSPSGSQ